MARGKVYTIQWKQTATGGLAVKRELDNIRDSSAGASRAHGRFRGDLAAGAAAARSAAAQYGLLGRTLGTLKQTLALSLGGLAIGAALNTIKNEVVGAEDAFAQLEAGVRSTGKAAGFSAEQLEEQASALQSVTTYADDAIESAQGILLTFTKVRGDNFKAAETAVLDLATRMKQDLNSAALLVGKALNDPVKGMTALTRSGVQFTDAQQELIKRLVDTGRVAEAQAQILAGLQTQFGGSARAARETLGGALASLHNSISGLAETIGGVLSPFLKVAAEGVSKLAGSSDLLVSALSGLGTAFVALKLSTFIASASGSAAAMNILLTAVSVLIAPVKSLTVAWTALNAAMAANPAVVLAVGIGAITAALVYFIRANNEAKQSAEEMAEALERQKNRTVELRDATLAKAEASIAAAQADREQLEGLLKAQEQEIRTFVPEGARREDFAPGSALHEALGKLEETRAALAENRRQIELLGEQQERLSRLGSEGAAVWESIGKSLDKVIKDKEEARKKAQSLAEEYSKLTATLKEHLRQLEAEIEAAERGPEVLARLRREHELRNYYLEQQAKVGAVLAAQLTELRRRELELADALQKQVVIAELRLRLFEQMGQVPLLPIAGADNASDAGLANLVNDLKEAADFTAAATTEEERRRAVVAEIVRLYDAGLVSQKTYSQVLRDNAEQFDLMQDAAYRWSQELVYALEPLQDAIRNTRDLLVDTFVEALRTGDFSFKQLWGNFLDLAAHAIKEFLKRWIAAMVAARAASETLGNVSGGGGGVTAWGRPLATAATGGGGFSTSGVVSGLAGSQAFWGGVYAIVIYAAIEALKHGPLETYSAIGSQQGQALVTEFRRSYQGQLDQFKSIGDAVADGINAALQELRGSIARLPSLAIGTYGNQFKVWVNGVRHIFSDVESAISFAISQALAQGEFTGLSPEVQAALQHSAARSLEELQADIATAVQLETINMGDVGRTIRERVTEFWRLFTEAARLGIPRTDLLGNFRQSWQKWRDELLGIVRPPAEQQQQDIREFNEALRREKAYAEAQLRAAEGQLLAAQLQLTAAQEMLEQSGRGDPEVGRLLSDARRLFELWTANVNDLRQILGALPSEITPEEAARARPRGRGGRGADRAAEIESFRESLEEIFLSVVPAAQRELISLNDRIRELWEEGRRLNISTEDLARAEAILREQYGRSLRDAIAPFLTTLPEILARYQADLRTIAEVRGVPRGERIRAGGPTDWQLNQAEANVRARAAEEVRATARAMAGLDDGLAGAHAQAEALRATVLGLGLSAEETAQQLAGIDLGEAFAIERGQIGVLSQLFGYLRDSSRHAAQVAEFERQRVEFEFAILRAQLEAWGLWERYAVVWGDAQKVALDAARRSGKTPQELAAENVARRQEEAAQELARAVEQWAASTQRLIDAQNKLRLGELSGLSARDQLQEARRQLDTVLAAARGGDIEAREAFPEAVEAYLRELQAFSPSSQLYAEQFRELDAIFTELIGQRFRFGNVTATGQFGLNPSTPTQAGAAGAAAQQQTTFSAAAAANVERLLLASGQEDVRHNRAIEGEVKRLREKVDELTAKDERQTKALEMLSEQIRALLEKVA